MFDIECSRFWVRVIGVHCLLILIFFLFTIMNNDDKFIWLKLISVTEQTKVIDLSYPFKNCLCQYNYQIYSYWKFAFYLCRMFYISFWIYEKWRKCVSSSSLEKPHHESINVTMMVKSLFIYTHIRDISFTDTLYI